jgi:hypothetical protein
LVNSKVED